jgi:hypothetical protein
MEKKSLKYLSAIILGILAIVCIIMILISAVVIFNPVNSLGDLTQGLQGLFVFGMSFGGLEVILYAFCSIYEDTLFN